MVARPKDYFEQHQTSLKHCTLKICIDLIFKTLYKSDIMSEQISRDTPGDHPVVIFDLDGTLVHDRPDEVTGRLWESATSQGVMKVGDVEIERLRKLREKYGHSIGDERQNYLDPLIKAFDTHIFHKDVAAIEQLARELVVADSLNQLLYDEVLAEAYAWQEQGASTIIISGSPSMYIRAFARAHNFDFGTGTRHYHNGNTYLPREAVSRAKEKHSVAEKMVQGVSDKLGKRAYLAAAYGDTVNDLSLLEAACEPVAINPKNGLASTAIERDYRTIFPRNAVQITSMSE